MKYIISGEKYTFCIYKVLQSIALYLVRPARQCPVSIPSDPVDTKHESCTVMDGMCLADRDSGSRQIQTPLLFCARYSVSRSRQNVHVRVVASCAYHLRLRTYEHVCSDFVHT